MFQKKAFQPEVYDRIAASFLIKTILIVKNNATGDRSCSQLLSLQPHHYALLASSGSAALRLIKHIKPDLFLLDYHLQDMNGLELYKQLHATKELEDVPAIIVGAHVLQDGTWGVEPHQLVILSKTFSLNELLRIIIKGELSAAN